MDFILTTKQVADFFGRSPRTVQMWGQAGCPKVRHGAWDLRAVVRWWAEHVYLPKQTKARPEYQLEDPGNLLRRLQDEVRAGNEKLMELLNF